ncbi:MAG: 16S rRNA (guanine(527)-N(7))-methyltransferase RsmG [Bacilli bacterium]|jgi:16S rRNA (guanine527-N7)-methyltransferase|nr:16S rRNA (guanine(527)-N(7))-methyltransferase RsmG [Bacilli bacterium]
MTENNFVENVKKLGIEINDKQLKQLEKYYELLIEWNEKINLTGITKKEDVYLKHFYDSLTMQKIVNLYNVETLCDVGTGAGFPGLVLKIMFPNLKITLIDALNKRINFLNDVIEKLELKDIETIHSRSEDYALKNREKFDVVTARAVASLPVLMELCVPLVKEQGYFIPLKANITEEKILSKNAISKLYLKEVDEIKFILPVEESNRCLVKYLKEKKTDKKYPRKFSEIKKRTL